MISRLKDFGWARSRRVDVKMNLWEGKPMGESEVMFGRYLLQKASLTVPRNCESSTIKVSVSAKNKQWTLEEPLPSIQEWNPDLQQITQVCQ